VTDETRTDETTESSPHRGPASHEDTTEDALRQLTEFVEGARWFGGKGRELRVSDVRRLGVIADDGPRVVVDLVTVTYDDGDVELYQLPLALYTHPEHRLDHAFVGWWDDADIGWTHAYDAVHDREAMGAFLRAFAFPPDGPLVFQRLPGEELDPSASSTAFTGEQSNSSVVFGEELILKAFRRVEPGINPELELLRFLSARGFPHIAPLAGWYEVEGRLIDATLGILQEYLAGARDGWELTLDELASDPEAMLERLQALGGVVGELHSALGSEHSDPAFSPDEPSIEALSIITANVDEQIERVFLDLPEVEAVEPLFGRGQDVRERLNMLSHVAVGGRVIRTHGDLHLGQTMLSDRGWVILDFEGEPARPLPERRLKRSPLRDVAGMLRSFSYATAGARLLRGTEPPADWEERARERFLEGYHGSVDGTLLPPGQQATEQLLAVFELEKAVYELRYELNNRPDWVSIPVAGILRLLESD
jgi:maltokinase